MQIFGLIYDDLSLVKKTFFFCLEHAPLNNTPTTRKKFKIFDQNHGPLGKSKFLDHFSKTFL